MTLHDCTSVWGGTTLIQSDPIAATVRDVVYMPIDPSVFLDQFGRWGLYRRSGELIEEAAYCRLAERVLIGQRRYLPDLPQAARAAAGRYVYGGPIIMHYGHFVTTALSRLWPIVRGGLASGTKIVVHSHQAPRDWFSRDYVSTLLGSLGLGPDDFVRLQEPTVIPAILVPRPAFEEQNYVHRVFRDVCALVRRNMGLEAAPRPAGGPVYLSKARHLIGTTRLVNEQPLQDALARRGVEIVYPETLSFSDQVKVQARASTIVATLGSGLHTSLFCPTPKRIIALAFGPEINSNYRLIDKLTGNQASYVHTESIEPTSAEGSTFSYVAQNPAAVAAELLERV